MKPSIVISFLSILLLFGLLLHASTNNKVSSKLKKTEKQSPKMEIKKDLDFIPASVFL
jgi:hypothetical protein